MAEIQEICTDKSPCQGLKLAMESDIITKVDSDEEVLMADGFIAPEERFFFAIRGRPEQFGSVVLNTLLPIECCPFCSDAEYISNA